MLSHLNKQFEVFDAGLQRNRTVCSYIYIPVRDKKWNIFVSSYVYVCLSIFISLYEY